MMKSFDLTKEEFNYLLPAINRAKLSYIAISGGNDRYSFISDDIEETDDMINRLKGLYNYFGEFPSLLYYNCSKHRSLTPFREFINKQNNI